VKDEIEDQLGRELLKKHKNWKKVKKLLKSGIYRNLSIFDDFLKIYRFWRFWDPHNAL
jgi:hypothetical protein